jgi:hypothetical protein
LHPAATSGFKVAAFHDPGFWLILKLDPEGVVDPVLQVRREIKSAKHFEVGIV